MPVYNATLLNPACGNTYVVPITADTFEQAVIEAKRVHGYQVLSVQHLPREEVLVDRSRENTTSI